MGIKKSNTDNTSGMSNQQKKTKSVRDAKQNRIIKAIKTGGKAIDNGTGKR